MRANRTLSLLLLILCSGQIYGQRYGFEILSLEEGLPQAGVYDLIQSPDGQLWIATEGGGLACYDGRKFSVLDDIAGLPDNTVRCLAIGNDGVLFAGTANGGVFCVSHDSVSVPESLSPLSEMHVRGLDFDMKGHLWIATLDNGIYKWDGQKVFEIPSDLGSSLKCRDIQVLPDGRKFVATDIGLATIQNDRLVRPSFFIENNELSIAPVIDLFLSNVGDLWVAMESGAFCVQESQVKALDFDQMRGRRVRSIAEDAKGNLWFGTDMGLFRVRIDEKMNLVSSAFFDKNSGLSNERIRKVLVDKNQILWVGTYFGGVCKLVGEAFVTYDERIGLERGSITCLAALGSGKMAIGYFGGRILVFDSGLKSVTHRFDLAENTEVKVTAILAADDRSLLACSNLGTFRLSLQTGQIERLSGHYGNDLAKHRGEILIAADDGLHRLSGSLMDRVSEKACSALLSVNDSMLIAGIENEILLSGAAISDIGFTWDTLYTGENSFVGGFIGPDGSAWLSTDGSGILKFDGKNLVKMDADKYLPTAFINSLVIDASFNLVAGSKKGITLMELDSQKERVLTGRTFDSSEGLSGKEIARKALDIDESGTIWLGTVSGIQTFNPKGLHFDPSPPDLVLREVLVNYAPISASEVDVVSWSDNLPVSPVFSHDQNHVSFVFDAVELSGREKVRFQFKLEGRDPDWSAIQSNPEVTFAQLTPGAYVFLLRACNKDGVWSNEPHSYSFSIKAPFYMSWWFILITILVLSGMVWLFIRIRLGILKKENLLLENRVNERTVQLAEEKKKSDELLLNILPGSVANELKEKGSAAAQKHKIVTVLFSDFKGFTSLTETLSSDELVALLHQCFTAFDSLCAQFGVEKIKTIGDAYMCATGLPESDVDHAKNMVLFAQEMIRTIHKINSENSRHGIAPWLIRIGIHSGPVIAGVVGHRKFAYDIWGDTVNIASRMESNGEPFQINVSEETMRLLVDDFRFIYRGKMEVKNKGLMDMYFIDQKTQEL